MNPLTTASVNILNDLLVKQRPLNEALHGGPSKCCPMLRSPQGIFIAAPQINFPCSLNHICRLTAHCNFFHLLPEFMECSFNIHERNWVNIIGINVERVLGN